MHIRHAQAEDSFSLSRICLLTANAGQSAESQHSVIEMPGLIYAEPYVHMPHTAGFVLASSPSPEEERLLGYVLFAYDTRKFEDTMEKDWFPRLREKYPISMTENANGEQNGLTSQDIHYIKLFYKLDPAPEACIRFSPAHLVSSWSQSHHAQATKDL